MLNNPFSGCGIVGAVSNKERILSKISFKAMLNSLKHRGPDSNNIWQNQKVILGHTRLSILDPSARGSQPMLSGSLVITYNGEIYNYQEIKNDLLKLGVDFVSHTDTEVILKGFEVWGEKILDKLNGMFSFCIYDFKKNYIFLARDQLGIKPLYYYHDSNVFLFSSEVQSLMQSDYIFKNINFSELHKQILFSSYLKTNNPDTLLQNISSLKAGCFLKLDLITEKLTLSKYWDFAIEETNSNIQVFFRDSKVEELKYLIEKAIIQRIPKGMAVGSFLSGGLDSSIICYVASNYLRDYKLKSYTINYQDNNSNNSYDRQDLKYSYLMQSKLKNLEANLVPIQVENINLECIDRIIDFCSLPDDPRLIATLYKYEQVHKDKIRVVLNGQGADEIMGGYANTNCIIRDIISLRNQSDRHEVKKIIKNSFMKFLDIRPHILNPLLLRKQQEICDEMYDYFNSFDGDLMRKAHCFLSKTILQRILKFEDMLSMSYSVECRLPYLDKEVVDCAFSVPFSLHIDFDNRVGKCLLKDGFSKLLPKEIISRPKTPFPKFNYSYLHQELKNYFLHNYKSIMQSSLVFNVYNKNIKNYNALTFSEIWSIIGLHRLEKKLFKISE